MAEVSQIWLNIKNHFGEVSAGDVSKAYAWVWQKCGLPPEDVLKMIAHEGWSAQLAYIPAMDASKWRLAIHNAYENNNIATARLLERRVRALLSPLDFYVLRADALKEDPIAWLARHGLSAVCVPRPDRARIRALRHLAAEGKPVFESFCNSGQMWHAQHFARLLWRYVAGVDLTRWVYTAMGYDLTALVRWLRRRMAGPLPLGNDYPNSVAGAVATVCERGDLDTIRWIFAHTTLTAHAFLQSACRYDDDTIVELSEYWMKQNVRPLLFYACQHPHVLRWFADYVRDPNLVQALAAELCKYDAHAAQGAIRRATGVLLPV